MLNCTRPLKYCFLSWVNSYSSNQCFFMFNSWELATCIHWLHVLVILSTPYFLGECLDVTLEHFVEYIIWSPPNSHLNQKVQTYYFNYDNSASLLHSHNNTSFHIFCLYIYYLYMLVYSKKTIGNMCKRFFSVWSVWSLVMLRCWVMRIYVVTLSVYC